MDEKQELIEIYKLHATLADSVSRQRGTTNRFYLLLMSGLSVLFSALLQLRNGVPLWWSDGGIRAIRHITVSRLVRPHPLLPPAKFW